MAYYFSGSGTPLTTNQLTQDFAKSLIRSGSPTRINQPQNSNIMKPKKAKFVPKI